MLNVFSCMRDLYLLIAYCVYMKCISNIIVWRIDVITVNIVKGIDALFGLSFGPIYVKYIMR